MGFFCGGFFFIFTFYWASSIHRRQQSPSKFSAFKLLQHSRRKINKQINQSIKERLISNCVLSSAACWSCLACVYIKKKSTERFHSVKSPPLRSCFIHALDLQSLIACPRLFFLFLSLSLSLLSHLVLFVVSHLNRIMHYNICHQTCTAVLTVLQMLIRKGAQTRWAIYSES